MTTIGDKMHAVRKRKKITLTALAQQVGSTAGYLSMLERDKVPNPSVTVFRRIADALDVSVSYLMDDNAAFEGDYVVSAIMNRVIALQPEQREVVAKFLTAIEANPT